MIKKIAILSIVVIAAAGCQAKSAANPNVKNDNGARSVSVTDNGDTVNKAFSSDEAKTPAPEQNESAEDVVEIREKMFVAQTNDVYYNAEDYLGKTLRCEGIFNIYEVPEINAVYYSVIRYGPGCCGTDANPGFEVIWNKDYPEQNDWVEATGVLEEYEENGYKYLRLALSSLNVLTTRGAEYVTQ
jgi:uncharacterized membrane protein YcgQ (UPF0703/DUF1980 family)